MRVLLSGYYGFGNAGDEALLEGLTTGLKARGYTPVVASAAPRATQRLHGVAATHRIIGLPTALLGCQALISGGGGLLQDVTSSRSLDYYLTSIRAARLLGKRVAVYGQSVGPLSARGKQRVARTLRGVPIAVRDRASVELLATLGLSAHLVADAALLLAPPPEIASSRCARPEFAPLERAPAERAPAEADSAPVGNSRSPQCNDRTLLIPRAGYPELGDALAAVGLQERARGRSVGVLSLHPEHDEPEAARLVARLGGVPIHRARDHRSASYEIARSGIVVSARLHGLILALTAGVPAVGLVYDPKVAGFLLESNGVGFAPPIDVPALVRAVEVRRTVPDAIRQSLRERAAAGLDWLDRSLSGGP